MALSHAEIAKSMFAITKETDRIALWMRTCIGAIYALGAGTSLSVRIDASGVTALEARLQTQELADLDSWLTNQAQVETYTHGLLKDWITQHYEFARALLANIGEPSFHGPLFENMLSYYGLRVPEYFFRALARSQGAERVLDPDVVFAEDGRLNSYNKLDTLQATGGPLLLSQVNGVDGKMPFIATPNRILWICTVALTTGDMVGAAANAYGQSSWSAADAASAAFAFTIPDGTTVGQTGHLVAAGTGATAIKNNDSAAGTVTLLTPTTCRGGMTLGAQINPDPDTELAITFILAGTSGITGGDALDIAGTDANDAEMTESIDVSAGNGSYVSTELFKTITNIDCAGWANGTLTVTQRRWDNTCLVLGASETGKFYVSATAFQKALIIGADSDSGEAVSVVVTIVAKGDEAGNTHLFVNQLHLNIDTGYSIWPMFHQLDSISGSPGHAATDGEVELYPLGDRMLEW